MLNPGGSVKWFLARVHPKLFPDRTVRGNGKWMPARAGPDRTLME